MAELPVASSQSSSSIPSRSWRKSKVDSQGSLQHRNECRGRVTVYTITGCAFCRRAMATLNDLGLPYTLINLDDVPDFFKEDMLTKSGGKTSVPQIFFNDMHLGGFEQLENAISSGNISKYISEVVENSAPDTAPSIPKKEREFDVLDDGYDLQFTCERDAYSQLVQEIRKSDLIADRFYHLRNYKQCFIGRDLVDWLMDNNLDLDREGAVNIAQMLVRRKFAAHVCQEHSFKDGYYFYRLLDDFQTGALNTKHTSDCEPQSASELAETLRGAIVMLYSDYLSEDGRHVDYTAMKESSLFEHYERLSCQLQRVDISALSWDVEKTAFFINIYNALVIHANVVRGPPTNAWERQRFFTASCYMIGGCIYTLQDIENGILRGNRKGVGAFRRPFGKADPRMVAVVTKPDPRVHFALVCGAKSCPPIKTYSSTNLNKELELSANAFLQDGGVHVNLEKKEVQLNRILSWYRSDFGSTSKEILLFVAEHIGPCKLQKSLLTLMEGTPKVTYLAYDWSLNGS